MTPEAWKAFSTAAVDFDTIANGAVQVRVTVKNPGKLTKEMLLSGQINGATVNARITAWADLFSGSTIEAKKMIVAQLIKQVGVGRDYALEIDLNVNYEMFGGMLQEDHAEGKQDTEKSA